MRINDAFPSKYLVAADLCDTTIVVVIESVQMEEVGEEKQNKPVVYFRGKQKGLVLNKTNAITIADMHGQDTDDWGGKKISLWPTQTELKGRAVACIRVKLGSGGGQQTAPVAQAEAFVENIKTATRSHADNQDELSEDDIPF